MRRILYFASLAFLLIACSNESKQAFEITNYGAVGDSATLNTAFIQSAIDACNEAGGGKVIIPKGIYISGTILLKDNVELYFDIDAKLVGSKNPMDYKSIDTFIDATGQERGKCLLGAMDVSNVKITGEGVIDGNGIQFQYENVLQTMEQLGVDKSEKGTYLSNRPFLLRFVRAKNIELKNINLRQPAAWTCHFYQSNNIKIEGISIYSHAHHNNDGIDLDSSSDVVISNCTIDSGDDALCFKATSPMPTENVKVYNCKLKSDWGAIKFGTEAMGDFNNISIKNCLVHDTRGGGIKMLSVDGSNISNIVIDSIEMQNVEMPLFVRLGERLRTYRNAPKQEVGSIKNVIISNINAVVRDTAFCRVNPPTGIFITGTPNHKIASLSLRNIKIELPGYGNVEHLKNSIPEDEERYPEFSFFGVLPAYGIYARHIENLNMHNITFTLRNTDHRKEVILDDVLTNSLNEVAK